MPFLAWSDKLSVGVTIPDAEHQQLVAMLNDLYDAIMARQAREHISAILDEMISYTGVHFQHEEALLMSHGYPDYGQHCRIHADLVKTAVTLREKLMVGNATVPYETFIFLYTWLKNHIMTEDAKYGPFLREKGVV